MNLVSLLERRDGVSVALNMKHLIVQSYTFTGHFRGFNSIFVCRVLGGVPHGTLAGEPVPVEACHRDSMPYSLR